MRVLGKSIAEAIALRAVKPVLTIGRDQFRRSDLAGVACFNFTAASNLSNLIAALQLRDTRDLFDNIPPTALVLPRLGSVSLAVLGAAFEAKGLGGDAPLETWFTNHRAPEASREFVTFDSLKHAEAKRESGEKKARKHRRDRSHGRRDQAQRIRGDRYLTRHEKRTTNVPQ
jgi:hypothetical protein